MLKARHTFDLHTKSSCHRLMNDERRAAAAAAPINWNMYHILNGKKCGTTIDAGFVYFDV